MRRKKKTIRQRGSGLHIAFVIVGIRLCMQTGSKSTGGRLIKISSYHYAKWVTRNSPLSCFFPLHFFYHHTVPIWRSANNSIEARSPESGKKTSVKITSIDWLIDTGFINQSSVSPKGRVKCLKNVEKTTFSSIRNRKLRQTFETQEVCLVQKWHFDVESLN